MCISTRLTSETYGERIPQHITTIMVRGSKPIKEHVLQNQVNKFLSKLKIILARQTVCKINWCY